MIETQGAPELGTWQRVRGGEILGDLRVIPGEGQAAFELYATRGAPSYNSGVLAGNMSSSGGLWSFETTEFGGTCKLSFYFLPNRVHIEQSGDWTACGFGYGVIAEGDYELVSRDRPVFETREAEN